MKVERTFDQHLVVRQLSLHPGSEWAPKPPGWSVAHLASGTGYWIHPRLNRELAAGSVVILSPMTQGAIRASQIGEASIQFFNIAPERLTDVVTLGEQKALEEAAGKAELSCRFFPPEDPVSVEFRELFGKRGASGLHLRLQLVMLFFEGISGDLILEQVEPEGRSTKEQLEAFLLRMPAECLLRLEFTGLARQIGCSPRHLSRTFTEVVGTSFREKQAEIRLARAQELLATTESKVCEVAPESGYQSVSLFNMMFKRHFGVSPGRWRRGLKSRQVQTDGAESRSKQGATRGASANAGGNKGRWDEPSQRTESSKLAEGSSRAPWRPTQ
jgi:AraC-like DNA-binding protein